jgi:hypothetical protein
MNNTKDNNYEKKPKRSNSHRGKEREVPKIAESRENGGLTNTGLISTGNGMAFWIENFVIFCKRLS